MSDYLITPESQERPVATRLMEELHRKGFPVEITLKGPDSGWESIRFTEHDGSNGECVLSLDPGAKVYRVSISPDAPLSARELQLYVVETLLREVGGFADHGTTRERLNLQQFSLKLQAHHSGDRKASDWAWVAFAWLVALGALVAFLRVEGPNRWTILVVLVFAGLSACGLTYLQLRRE
ncbi:MAG TPA: hypothetical protein VHE12_07760 [bacterium]|nr:hypothetical protein [bacterium]